ncbi:hypothetical protein CHS0354_001999 [Potamilus streckersoni]|uniref:RNA 2-O ribose methyltransferase substrate binding domain-containing protein n=1 Tax=Potamilus streckersoni TaxID=2493646 RepID=A0AAE0T5M2_9BIVA|nr:hypothetical protein CHS0354_001999 [Potamilus streckersoni]
MSKSLGNFIPAHQLASQYHPEVIRLFCIKSHYRQKVNFTHGALAEAADNLDRLYTPLMRCASASDIQSILKQTLPVYTDFNVADKSFSEAMGDDFNTPSALAALFAAAGRLNALTDTDTPPAQEELTYYIRCGQILGIFGTPAKDWFKQPRAKSDTAARLTPEEIEALIRKRTDARRRKDWQAADAVRDRLKQNGIIIQDKGEETIWQYEKSEGRHPFIKTNAFGGKSFGKFSGKPKREEDGERPFRPRREEGEDKGGERPFRPKREFGEGERSFRPKREFGEGERSFRPKREFGEGERSFRPKREFGEGERNSSPRREFGEGERTFRPRREFGEGERTFRPRREFGEGERTFRPRREFGEGERTFRPRREFGEGRGDRSFGTETALNREQPASDSGAAEGGERVFRSRRKFNPSEFRNNRDRGFEGNRSSERRNFGTDRRESESATGKSFGSRGRDFVPGRNDAGGRDFAPRNKFGEGGQSFSDRPRRNSSDGYKRPQYSSESGGGSRFSDRRERTEFGNGDRYVKRGEGFGARFDRGPRDRFEKGGSGDRDRNRGGGGYNKGKEAGSYEFKDKKGFAGTENKRLGEKTDFLPNKSFQHEKEYTENLNDITEADFVDGLPAADTSTGKNPDRKSASGKKYSAPEGKEHIYGFNAAVAVLNGNRKIYRIFCKPERESELMEIISQHDRLKSQGIVPEVRDFYDLTDICGTDEHQGVVIECSVYALKNEDDLWADMKHASQFAALDQVQDPHNLGAVIRNCAFFNIGGVIITADNSAPVNAAVAKASAGNLEQVNVYSVTNLTRVLERMKEDHFWIIGADMEGNDLRRTDAPDKFVLVLGSEGKGMRRLTAKTCDMTVSVKGNPAVESMNVASACSVMLYALTAGQSGKPADNPVLPDV